MTSRLLLAGAASAPDDRWTLEDDDEAALATVLGQLAPFVTRPEDAAVVHERDGEVIAAWDRSGAVRLARALPPAYGELTDALVDRYGVG